MWLSTLWRKVYIGLALCSLLLLPVSSALAQSPDQQPATEVAEDGDSEPDSPYEERGEFSSGESSEMDAGKSYVFLPTVQGGDNSNVAAAAPAAVWRNVIYDEMCSFPAGWTRYDYNGTGHLWVYRTIDGFCTAQPSAYVLKEHTQMYRNFSLVGALNAQAVIRFKMKTEQLYDKLVIEYTCNSGLTWYGTSAFSGNRGWTTTTLSLYSCRGYSNVQLRISFVSDKIVIPLGAIAPVIDYVKVQKFS